MRFRKLLLLFFASNLCFAAQADRIAAPISGSQMIALQGNIHGLAQAEYDQGRADSSRVLSNVSIAVKPSAAQQSALQTLLAQQRNPASPNYHKWLRPAQFAARFGLSQNDLNKITSWLQSQGLTVTRIANSHNQIFFQGTVAQIESAFQTEIHNYLVNSELHYANSSEPSIPAALSGIVLAVHHLNNFQPKPHSIVREIIAAPQYTSHISGDHFVAPGDFATIYNVQPLYNAGTDGSGQKIALTGQSSINLSDVANFRSAAGLPTNVPTLLLEPGTGTSTRCPGDEGESDLDVEWSGAVAKDSGITLVYAGVDTGETCTNRTSNVFDALQYAIDQNIAPIISNSYGNCESAIGLAEAETMQGWIQQANSQGQTVLSASGDDGPADCDFQVTSATHGLAVDIPAAIPEVTGMGGAEFTGDPAATVSGGNAPATTYWSGTIGGNDTLSSALSYIPEEGWNDTAEELGQSGGVISASGGGASIFFAKPSWQTGTGVPNDGKRDVPDLALNASPEHDPYLFCSEDGANGAVVASCTDGFRTGAGGDFTAVGGTSAAAPTFAGILALINQHLGLSGSGNINPNLYSLSVSNPAAFHDITTGSNIVPCTAGSTGCTANSPFQYGFSATAGYDQVTGLGSVDANELALAWAASLDPDFALTSAPTTVSVSAGQPASFTLTISPITGSTGMVINFSPTSCTGLPAGATCSFNPASVNFDGTNNATTVVTIATAANMALPAGAQTFTITANNASAGVGLTVTKTTASFTLSTTAATFPVGVGGTDNILVTVQSQTGFLNSGNGTTILPLTYTCSGIPVTAEISCIVNNGQPTTASTVTVNIVTTPVTTKLEHSPLTRAHILYAALLPGILGILCLGPRARTMRFLSLIVFLGLSTLWLGACGGKKVPTSNVGPSSLPNAGTPPGNYTVTINATTGGAVPITGSLPIHLSVGAQ
jgi:subtilase family serine protease